MNFFNPSSSAPAFPTSPQIPRIPFGFGLSTITDLIGLTEPTPTPIRQPAPPQAQNNQRQQHYQTSAQTLHPGGYNLETFHQYQQPHETQLPTGYFNENSYHPSTSLTTVSYPSTTTTYSDFNRLSSSTSQLPVSHYPQLTPINPSHSTTNIQYESQHSQPQMNTLVTSASESTPIPTSSPFSPCIHDTTGIPKPVPIIVTAPKPKNTLTLPTPTTTSNQVLHDLTRRSASPTSSGVQIDLINLRQKLCRDIQNNMDTVTKQQEKVKDLQSRANVMETEYAYLKGNIEDLKRKQNEHQGKLDEIDSLVKSALTMSSFSSPSSLRVEMIEAENENDTTIIVVAAGE